jgi:DNA-binding IclR family transcriptional regulator
MKKAKSDYLIQSVSRALDILEAFTPGEGRARGDRALASPQAPQEQRIQAARDPGDAGYVEQDRESGNYRPG